MNIKTCLSTILTVVWLACPVQMSARDNRFYVYNAANGLSDNSAQTIHCTKTGRLVITTMGQINFFDGQKFSFIDSSSENMYPLDNYSGNYHLYFDCYHHLWLKNTHSVTCVNLATERFVDSITDIFRDFGVSDKVTDIFVDQKNVPWLLTEEGLWNVATKQTYKVKSERNLQDLEVYRDKYLMLFYDNGELDVMELNTASKVFESKAYDAAAESHYNQTSLTYPVGNRIFQIRNGRNEGIAMYFDIGQWEWKTILKTPYYLSDLMVQDSTLYIPSAYGYWTYDLQTEQTEHVEKLELALGGELLTDINSMAFDKQGGLWVGTEKRGLLYSRPLASPFTVHDWTDPRATELAVLMDKLPEPITTYRERPANCMFRDSRGWVWVGTSSGLQVYKDKSDNLPQVITRHDGLLNNVVHTIIEDGSHNIWVGTSFGICCLLIENNKLRYINSYNEWDKIPSESFVNGRAIRLSDGTIAMQMLDHVIEFNPDKMVTITKGVAYDIYPKLIRLMVNGNNIRTGQEVDGNVILKKAITRTGEINLNYNQNSLSLTFSALNYFRPQQTYYRVRIVGLDDIWHVLTRYNSGGQVDSQGQLHLPLMSLLPGTYKIQVQTSMIPDQWTTEPYEWTININEPWWRTTGLLAIGVLVLGLLLAINVYYYVKNYGLLTTRRSEEQGVIKRLRGFAERCSQKSVGLLLEPVPEEYLCETSALQTTLSPEFMEMMARIMDAVLAKDTEKLTMHELSSVAGMDLQPFYQLVIDNIHKNPRPLAKKMMLEKAERLLTTTQKDIAEIATECSFVSPNYFIGIFYRTHQMLPQEYRRQHANH